MLTFTHPTYLWALLLLPLLWVLARLAPRRMAAPRRVASLVLRTVIVAAVVLALAGAEWRRPVDALTVAFVVDVSDSMPSGSRDQIADYLRETIGQMPDGNQAAIVLFGEEALVERSASELRRVEPLASVPLATRTDIGEALQLGLAMLPDDSQKRLVLLSDGQQNVGDARVSADLVAARNVTLDVIPLGGAVSGPEVQLTMLDAPESVALGEQIELTVRLDATVESSVRLRLFGDDRLLYDEQVSVPAGGTSYRIPVQPSEQGFNRYRALVEAANDTRPQNNEAAAYTQVTGPPRVAIVTTDEAETQPLVAALQAAQMQVDLLAPNALPQTLPELAQYDSIVLNNVSATTLPPTTMELLPNFVRELGHGLVMVGGPESYGAGQWLRTPVETVMPVEMEVRPRDQQANVAIVFAVDKSGSMGRCHCDDPTNAAAQAGRLPSGLPKVDIAKSAIMQAGGVLSSMDYIGVIAFDELSRWALETQRFPGYAALEEAVAPIDAVGGTNIYTGIASAGEGLAGVDAKVRHIILLTDGWGREGNYHDLAVQLANEGITLSVVAAGAGSAPELRRLAEEGGGAFYPAVAMEDVPQIFLKETVRISGRYIVEEPFYPTLMSDSAILRGLGAAGGSLSLPGLLGYNGSTLRPDATEVLRTPRGEPLLATRFFGLGRTVAWTSDLSGRWASSWLDWEGFPTFAAQLVAWSFPDPQSDELSVRGLTEGATTTLEVATRDQTTGDVRATILSPDLVRTELSVPQVGVGRYRVPMPVTESGAYLVTVTEQDAAGEIVASRTRGIVVPYSPEYRIQQADETLLTDLAQRTGGRELTLAAFNAIWETPQQPVSRAQPLWPWLMLLALLLFPFDVAVRRVMWGSRELAAARDWRRERRAQQRTTASKGVARTEQLDDLFAAKQRASRPSRRPTEVDTPPAAPPATAPSAAAKPVPPPRPAPPRAAPDAADDRDDTLSRLRDAKRRARR
ncbi:MAG: VWA domain-containing protein [Anaerolineales bacterium]|nr:VWA domain-containing protein [Anaerolineales bacterium]MCB9129285.1 VWA domain-containing protein [Ardenticatenales bacterium]